jgi:hypothetical protein
MSSTTLALITGKSLCIAAKTDLNLKLGKTLWFFFTTTNKA